MHEKWDEDVWQCHGLRDVCTLKGCICSLPEYASRTCDSFACRKIGSARTHLCWTVHTCMPLDTHVTKSVILFICGENVEVTNWDEQVLT